MEDAIVAQVEWYLGRVNLANDVFLKRHMDPDLWVDLSLILAFPKMIRMGATDPVDVSTLLRERSQIVEVESGGARIRPAWARRSSIFISDVPVGTTFEDIAALLQNSTGAEGEDSHAPPQGLLSVHAASETSWIVTFHHPTGAEIALPLVLDKTVNGQKIRAEAIYENPLKATSQYRPPPPQHSGYGRQSDQNAQQGGGGGASAASAGVPQGSSGMSAHASGPLGYSPMNSMLNPLAMPVPVMHPSAHDALHLQYGYASHAAYVPHTYGQHNVQLPPQYVNARGMPTGPSTYMMGYPQGSHPYDPSSIGVPSQIHQGSQVQSRMDGAGPGQRVTNAAGGQQQSGTVDGGRSGPISYNSGQVAEGMGSGGKAMSGGNGVLSPEGGEGVAAGPGFPAAENSLPQPMVGVDGRTYMPSAQMIQPMSGQAMAPSQMIGVAMSDQDSLSRGSGKTPVDVHYVHRAAMMGDPSIVGMSPTQMGVGYVRGAGRGQHPNPMHRGDRSGQRSDGGRDGPRSSGPSSIDGAGRNSQNRKGKKNNRNGNARHGQQGDRHADSRGQDGKNDGRDSLANRDDLRGGKDERHRPNPGPDLNEVHFPPLPGSTDAVSPSSSVIKGAREWKDAKAVITSEDKGSSEVSNSAAPPLPPACASMTRAADEDVGKDATEKEDSAAKRDKMGGLDTRSVDTNISAVTDPKGLSSVDASAKDSADDEKGDGSRSRDGSMSPGSVVDSSSTDAVAGLGDRKRSERSVSPDLANGSTLSYAAILRSKKPTPPRSSNPSLRGTSDGQTKANVSSGSPEASNVNSGQVGRERPPNARRKKSGTSNRIPNGDSARREDGVAGSLGSAEGGPNSNPKSASGGVTSNVSSGVDRSRREVESKAKARPEAARPNSVWANKPKSVFQAAASVPASRSTTPVPNVESKKSISPVLSADGDSGRQRGSTDESVSVPSPPRQTDLGVTEIRSNSVSEPLADAKAELPDINSMSLKQSSPNEADGDTVKASKSGPVASNGTMKSPAKGAWASGGPRGWPKGSTTNVEKSGSTS